MAIKLILRRKVESVQITPGVFPGVYDYDQVIDFDADAMDESGKMLFSFRKKAVSEEINSKSPKLAEMAKKFSSLRPDAAGPQYYEVSRHFGYARKRGENFLSETEFTFNCHREYKELFSIVEALNALYCSNNPEIYYWQRRLEIDPHFQIGRSIFTQGIVLRSYRTGLHQDKGNIPGTMSNLICLGDNSFQGGLLVFPEYAVAINLRPRDYLSFLGEELFHGNTEILGPGTRVSVICYSRSDFMGKSYREELCKLAKKLDQDPSYCVSD